jgi:hypothetical protein
MVFGTGNSLVPCPEDSAVSPGAAKIDGSGGIRVQCPVVSIGGTGIVPVEESGETEIIALRDKAGADRWWYAWLTGYSAATAGQAIVYFSSDDKSLRQDMALGAATTFLGALNQLITPVDPPRNDYPTYREYVSGEKPMTAGQAATLLRDLAAWERKGRSWKTHALAGAVNLGSGLITWLGFKRSFMDGLENFAINTAITEAQIWTQPIRAARDYEKYCRKAAAGAGSSHPVTEGEWAWSIFPGGFYISYTF